MTPKEMSKQVKQRVADETAREKPSEKESNITPKFVKACLEAEEIGDGILFVTLHRGLFLYVESTGQWLRWDGHHWAVDEKHEAEAAVENVVAIYIRTAAETWEEIRELQGQEDSDSKIKRLKGYKKNLEKRSRDLRRIRRRDNCLKAAHTCKEPLSIHGRELDQNPWLLACPNGVVELKTGRLRPGQPEDYLLLACPTEYQGIEGPCPAWKETLYEIMDRDASMVEFLQRLLGHALVGEVLEHIFIVFIGPEGRNGKGVILGTLSDVLGPLARPIRPEMLLDTYQIQNSSGPTPDIMSLRGPRIVWASETKDGVRLSNAKVKWLTGGDTLTGRNPHDKFETTFKPTHTLILSSNYRPEVDAKDQALWERMINVPFDIRFLKNREPTAANERKADLYLREKLQNESSGILGWLVEGCLKWQLQGLDPPEKVLKETQQYQQEEDVWQKFYDECVEPGDDLSVSANDLYDAFYAWWKRNVSKNVPAQQKFGRKIRPMFLDKDRSTGGVIWYFGGCLSDVGRDFLGS